MSVGWFINLADAEAYFLTERLQTGHWDGLSGDPTKTKAVIQGFNRIYYSSEFTTPLFADASADQLVILRKVNGEMAYYLAEHLEDEDIRKNLQAQAVKKAGVVKEDYSEDMLMDVPVPPWVWDMLKKGGFVTKTQFKIVEIERDMNQDLKK